MLLLASAVAWFALALGPVSAVTFPKDRYAKAESEVGVCLRSDDPLIPCLTSGAVHTLEAARSQSQLDLGDGLTLIQDYTEDTPETTGDPREGRTLLESVGLYMEQRYLHWDLASIYPGLVMRVGPSARGNLQFLLDKRRMVDDRSLSTGRLIMKRTLLPVLLGIKFNVATLIPLLFAGLIILVKKALLLSKFSFLLSGLSLLRPSSNYGSSSSGIFGGSGTNGLGSFGGGGGGLGSTVGGGGLGTFGPPKHIIYDAPINHQNLWLARENPDV